MNGDLKRGLLAAGGGLAAVAIYVATLEQPGPVVQRCPSPIPGPALCADEIVLSGPWPAGAGQFLRYEVTPDGSRVVFRVDANIAGKYELFSAPIAPPISGAAPTRLSQELAENRDVTLFEISPDGGRVAYAADPRKWTQYDLWSVPITGGTPKLLSPSFVPVEWDVDTFRWSSRGDQVVYVYGRNTTGVWSIFAVPAAGGGSVQLNPTPPLGGGVGRAFSAPLGNASFTCDCEVAGTVKGYVTPLPKTIFGDGFETGDVSRW